MCIESCAKKLRNNSIYPALAFRERDPLPFRSEACGQVLRLTPNKKPRNDDQSPALVTPVDVERVPDASPATHGSGDRGAAPSKGVPSLPPDPSLGPSPFSTPGTNGAIRGLYSGRGGGAKYLQEPNGGSDRQRKGQIQQELQLLLATLLGPEGKVTKAQLLRRARTSAEPCLRAATPEEARSAG